MSYSKEENYSPEITSDLVKHYVDILGKLGEDPEREGLIKTPSRVAKALQFLTHGYQLDPSEILRSAMFEEEYSEMVIVKDIEV
ncbi:MAG: GTP cyclohydrolase I, partial [Saprospiraceae bacterium]|nr:GTP cyclohydrolase I [Saprospiraceae bacterium]